MSNKIQVFSETPQTVHGRVLESVHISGYTFERACAELEWLLEDDRWKTCGSGFEDIRDFLATVDLSPFRIDAKHRKRLVKKLAELEASNVATAKAIGVDERTVRRDVAEVDSAKADSASNTPEESDSSEGQNSADAESPPASINGREAARTLEKKQRDAKRQAEKSQRKAEKDKREREAKPTKPKLYVCGVAELHRHVKPHSVDVVITDPPYPREFIPLYSELSSFCAHALRPGGLLVCMAGQSYLPEIAGRLSESLDYLWCCAYLTPGGQAVQQWDRKVNTFWKPLLIYSRGQGDGDRWIGDVLSSDVNDNDKDHHHWGQSESGLARVVRTFSEPKQLVCDPFLGGGTTAVVACTMGRKFIGCDVDEACVKTTKERLR